MNPDFIDLLRALSAAEARFLIGDAYAVARHARPRETGDLDVWVGATSDNATRIHRALRAFGAPLDDLTETDLTPPDLVYQVHLASRRIDILTSLTGLSFGEACATRVRGHFGEIERDFIGRDALVRNQRALGRPRDLADLESLGE